MTKSVKCVTGSHCGVGVVAVGEVIFRVKDSEPLVIKEDPVALYKLLVRSRDEETHEVHVENGKIRWLTEATEVGESEGADMDTLHGKLRKTSKGEDSVVLASDATAPPCKTSKLSRLSHVASQSIRTRQNLPSAVHVRRTRPPDGVLEGS